MPDNDYVILLHGFWRTGRSMKKLAAALSVSGYEVITINYPSSKATIQDIADLHVQPAIASACLDSTKKIHFVTHSMGGIIARYFLAHHPLPNLGRVVMLAPPNKGAAVADILGKHALALFMLGPALKQLATNDVGIARQLPPPDYQVGIIAGKHDGKVSVENTKLEPMADFLVVPHAHTFIMNSQLVIKAITHFLKHGKF